MIAHHGKQVGGFISDKAKIVGGKIESKIDSSEKLSKARDTTKAKATLFGKNVQTGFGKLMTKMGFKKEQQLNPDAFEQVDISQSANYEINRSSFASSTESVLEENNVP